MTSPACTVNTLPTDNGVDVTGGSTVTIQLADLAGVYAWSIQCINTDDVNDKDTVNAGLSINNITKTATFVISGVYNGSAIIFESKVNNGRDSNGRVDSTLTTRFGVFVLTGGGNRLFAFDERMESNAVYGWLKKMNDLVRNSVIVIGGLAGLGLYFSGGMYNVGAANDSITINADSIELKAAYKTLLDSATSSATASALAKRDAFGSINFAAIGCTAISATDVINTTVASPLGVLAPNGDISGNRLLVQDLGSNIFVIRKHASIANTIDISPINLKAIRLTTEDSGSVSTKPIDIITGTVSANGLTSGALTNRTGPGTVGTANSGAYSAGSGDVVNGTAGSVTISAGLSVGGIGGTTTIKGGNGATGGPVYILGGASSNGGIRGAPISLITGSGGLSPGTVYIGADGASIGLSTHGGRTMFIAECTTAPTVRPVNGVLLWSQGGILKAWGSAAASVIKDLS